MSSSSSASGNGVVPYGAGGGGTPFGYASWTLNAFADDWAPVEPCGPLELDAVDRLLGMGCGPAAAITAFGGPQCIGNEGARHNVAPSVSIADLLICLI